MDSDCGVREVRRWRGGGGGHPVPSDVPHRLVLDFVTTIAVVHTTEAFLAPNGHFLLGFMFRWWRKIQRRQRWSEDGDGVTFHDGVSRGHVPA